MKDCFVHSFFPCTIAAFCNSVKHSRLIGTLIATYVVMIWELNCLLLVNKISLCLDKVTMTLGLPWKWNLVTKCLVIRNCPNMLYDQGLNHCLRNCMLVYNFWNFYWVMLELRNFLYDYGKSDVHQCCKVSVIKIDSEAECLKVRKCSK